MDPFWSHPRAPPGEDRSHSSQHSPHHLPPSFLLNSKGLTSAPAKPWQLWKLRGFLWGVHRSLRRAQLPSQGASSRNVFLIFIVHSVCYRCVHCNYSNSLHMCCYAMGPFKLCQVFSFFLSFWNPNILFLPMFQLVCHAFLFYFKDQSWRQRESGVCRKQGPPAFLVVGQSLLIWVCVFSTSISCSLLPTCTSKPAYRHPWSTCAPPRAASAPRGRASMHSQSIDMHMRADRTWAEDFLHSKLFSPSRCRS